MSFHRLARADRHRRLDDSAMNHRRGQAALLCAALVGCGGGGSSAPLDAPGPVVFMGDSITAHWDDPTWSEPGDPVVTMSPADLLSAQLPGAIDAGIPGETTVEMLARFDTDVLALHPREVVILGGTNDLNAIANTSAPDTQSIATMAERAAMTGARVVIGLVPPVADLPWMQYKGQTGNSAVRAWNDDLRTLAAAYGYRVADYYSAMALSDGSQNPAMFYVDGLHPISTGYAAMWKVLEVQL